MGICQIYQNHSPNMVMSCDPGFEFRNFYFLPNYILKNFRNTYQIWGKLAQEQKGHRQKQIGGGKHPPPPQVLIGLKRFTAMA